MPRKHFFSLVVAVVWISFTLSAWPAIASEVITREFKISGFDRVEADFPFSIELIPSSTHQIMIELDKEFADSLEVVKRGSTLHLGMNSKIHSISHNCGQQTFKAKIKLPQIKGLTLSSAASAMIRPGFNQVAAFDLDLTAASSVKGSLDVVRARFELTGASQLKLSGQAENLDLSLSGASTVKLTDFHSKNADIDVSGASTAKLHVSGELKADVAGVSRLFYAGQPKIRGLSSTGMSKISHL